MISVFVSLFPVMFLSVIASYLVGSVPTGYWFAKYIFNIDITKSGSGNIGATNVARVLGKKYFALIFLIDFLKAFFTLYLIRALVDSTIILTWFEYSGLEFAGFECDFIQKILIFDAMALLIGNAYSIFLKFNGGKGVATTVGVLAYLFPFKLLLVFGCLWLFTVAATRRPFIASLVAIYLSCLVYYFYFLQNNNVQGNNCLFYLLVFICFWLTIRHRSNFKQI
jgi:glycerol-3-phosphate acyltransferase PlsY